MKIFKDILYFFKVCFIFFNIIFVYKLTNIFVKSFNFFYIMSDYFNNFQKGNYKNTFNNKRNNSQLDFNNLSINIKIEKNYYNFLTFFLGGLGIIFISIILLPKMISNIKLFILTFSLGSLIILFSFIFYYGPKEYFFTIRKKQFIIVYIIIISILIGFYIKFN